MVPFKILFTRMKSTKDELFIKRIAIINKILVDKDIGGTRISRVTLYIPASLALELNHFENRVRARRGKTVKTLILHQLFSEFRYFIQRI